MSMTSYSELSHSHCWAQGKDPACGQLLEGHKVCCLCEKEVPQEQGKCCVECAWRDYERDEYDRGVGLVTYCRNSNCPCHKQEQGWEKETALRWDSYSEQQRASIFDAVKKEAYERGKEAITDDSQVFSELDTNPKWAAFCERYLPGGMGEVHDDNLQSLIAELIAAERTRIESLIGGMIQKWSEAKAETFSGQGESEDYIDALLRELLEAIKGKQV